MGAPLLVVLAGVVRGTVALLWRLACWSGVSFFAGKPAPTGIAQGLQALQYLWERVYPRRSQHRFGRPRYLRFIGPGL
ncbi:hypothetical protein E5221_11995 [Pseudomonas sp. A2]|nr:hypothetical protein E5221_11995 [Pseudomonas sp. A2]